MARYPNARQVPANRAGGRYINSPWKIIHHKTIGLGENGLYDKTGSWPHFTVGPSGVQQHYDTEVAARALRNPPGGVETNSARAIQIELVAIIGRSADPRSLQHLTPLLRWLERTHGIPNEWPSGRPKQPTPQGRDPGGHNRNVHNWLNRSGHYGHCHVPENEHWDPFYYDVEWNTIHGSVPAPTPQRKRVQEMFMFWNQGAVWLVTGKGRSPFGIPPDHVQRLEAAGVPVLGRNTDRTDGGYMTIPVWG